MSKDIVVLVLGWWGSKPKPRAKYVDLYAAHGRVFTVVQDTLSTMEVTFPHLRRSAALRALAKLHAARDAYSREHGEGAEPAVVIHMMSNNGTIAYLCVRREMAISKRPEDEWVSRRLAGTVMDSTPGPLTGEVFAGAFLASRPPAVVTVGLGAGALLATALLVRKVGTRGLAARVLVLAVAGRALDAYLTWRFLSTMVKDPFAGPELYLYSKRDELVHHEAIRDVARRRERRGADVYLEEFKDSEHVNHLFVHYDQYRGAVGKLLDKVEA